MKKTIKRIGGLFLVICVLASFVTASISASERSLDYLPGDINNDGDINAIDAVLLAQYLADWDVEINTDAADVNSDFLINAVDAVLLAQYLADWDVVLRGIEIGDIEMDPDRIFNN